MLAQTNLEELLFKISNEIIEVNGNIICFNARKPDASKILSQLAVNLPNSLKYLRLKCRFNSESLKDLLINSMNYCLKILAIDPFDKFSSEHLCILADYFIKYFEKHNMKVLEIPSLKIKNKVMFNDVILYMVIRQNINIFDSFEL